MIFYHALRTNKYKVNDTKVHSLSHWMNSDNCWVYGFRVQLPSNRKRSYSFLLTAPGQPPCSVFTIPQVGDGPLSFWGGGLDSFQGGGKGSHGTKNRTSAFGFAALIFDVEKVLAQAIVTQNYHVQPKKSEKKKYHALQNCPYFTLKKKMVRLLSCGDYERIQPICFRVWSPRWCRMDCAADSLWN